MRALCLQVSLVLTAYRYIPTGGEFSPDVLDSNAKEKVKGVLKENSLAISSLCGDMGGYGF